MRALACVLMLAAVSACTGTEPRGGVGHTHTTAGKLTGLLLVASPKMPDPRFARTVIFIVRHDDAGAMGFVVNRPIGAGPAAKLLQGAEKSADETEDPGEVDGDGQIRVHYGGPVRPGKGFVIHSSDYGGDDTIAVTDAVSLTANKKILRDIAGGKGPRRGFMAMGYAGWSPGQLENEIRRKEWVTVTADEKLVLDKDFGSKWRRALSRLGIDL